MCSQLICIKIFCSSKLVMFLASIPSLHNLQISNLPHVVRQSFHLLDCCRRTQTTLPSPSLKETLSRQRVERQFSPKRVSWYGGFWEHLRKHHEIWGKTLFPRKLTLSVWRQSHIPVLECPVSSFKPNKQGNEVLMEKTQKLMAIPVQQHC